MSSKIYGEWQGEPVKRPADDRLTCWSDLEDMIRCLQELGWTLEKVSQVDEGGQPLRAVIRVMYRSSSSLPGFL